MAVNDAGATPEPIGRRLRRLRLDRDLSQRELASPGVSYAYISRIEAGTRQPSVKALRKLAQKLGVSAEYLETGFELADSERRELEIANAELMLRLDEGSAEATEALERVVEEAERAGDIAAGTRARAALGVTAFERGDLKSSVRLLEEVAESEAVSPSVRPDVFATLGRAYSALGSPGQAVELFERCVADLEEMAPDDVAARVRFATYLSFALTDMGDLDRAQSVLSNVLADSEHLADPYTRVRLYWSIARLAGYQGRLTVALDHYRRAVALLEATEDTLHLARAHVGCAWTLNAAGRGGEAQRHLAAAERLFGSSPAPADVASLRTEQAKAALILGEHEEAVGLARQAIDLLGESEPGEQGIAWLTLAEALAAQDEVPAADESFRRATALLSGNDRHRECAQAYRAWAKLLRGAGREADALDALERATDYAVRTQAPPIASAER